VGQAFELGGAERGKEKLETRKQKLGMGEEKRRQISPSGRNDGREVEMTGEGTENDGGMRRQEHPRALWFVINCSLLAFIGPRCGAERS
jgi:hypothetical protein